MELNRNLLIDYLNNSNSSTARALIIANCKDKDISETDAIIFTEGAEYRDELYNIAEQIVSSNINKFNIIHIVNNNRIIHFY